MKKAISATVIILAISMCILLSACGTGSGGEYVDNSVEQTQETSQIQAAKTEYRYRVDGMQNIGKNENGVYSYSTETDQGNFVYVYATCPKCNEMIMVEASIPKEHVGDQTYIYSGSECCTGEHDDQFYNGYFDYSVMFTRVDE